MRVWSGARRRSSSRRDLGAEPRTSDGELGWLLEELGYTSFQAWQHGSSWKLADTYVVIEESPDATGPHDRTRAGLNHLAFVAGRRSDVDRITEDALGHGWALLFGDRHPHAGGPDHYASYLENVDGFEVELVADVTD